MGDDLRYHPRTESAKGRTAELTTHAAWKLQATEKRGRCASRITPRAPADHFFERKLNLSWWAFLNYRFLRDKERASTAVSFTQRTQARLR